MNRAVSFEYAPDGTLLMRDRAGRTVMTMKRDGMNYKIVVETPIEEEQVDNLLSQDEDEYGVLTEVLGYGYNDGVLVQYEGTDADLVVLMESKYPDWEEDYDYAERISDYRA